MDICRAARTMLTPKAIFGAVSWPIFSLSSFSILCRLQKMGLRPASVIDIGANIGQFSISAAKLFPECKVWSFEPVPKSFEMLERNTKGMRNIYLRRIAIGDSNEERIMTINSHSHSSSLLPLGKAHIQAFPWAREEDDAKVEVKTLDYIASSLELASPVLLKIDVQGYEGHVLRGANSTLQKVDWVVLEASFLPLYVGEKTFLELSNYLESLGFEFIGPLDWLPHPKTGEILQMDALFKKRSI